MVFYIVLNGRLPASKRVQGSAGPELLPGKEEQFKQRDYRSVNDIALEYDRPLMTEMWRILLMNTKLTDLIICFSYWSAHVTNLLRFAIGHGIKTHLYDLGNNETRVVHPIANLPRNQGYDAQAPKRRCPDCGIMHTGSACPQCHIIYDAPTPLLDAVHMVINEIGQSFQVWDRRECRTITKVRQMRRDNQLNVINQLQRSDLQENMAACIDAMNTALNIPVILDRMQRWSKPYLKQAERDDRFIDIPLVNPLTSHQTIVEFVQGWAWLYEIPTPSDEINIFIVAGQLLCYLNEGIKPKRPLREDPDQSKIERLRVNTNFADLLDKKDLDELANEMGVDIRRYRPIIQE